MKKIIKVRLNFLCHETPNYIVSRDKKSDILRGSFSILLCSKLFYYVLIFFKLFSLPQTEEKAGISKPTLSVPVNNVILNQAYFEFLFYNTD